MKYWLKILFALVKYEPSGHKYLSFNIIQYYIKLERLTKLNKFQVPNLCSGNLH